jgi:hypothetical protein
VSLEVIRRIVRYVAAGTVPVAIAAAVIAMIRPDRLPGHEILDGAILTSIILATWVGVEVLVRCKDEIIAAQPPAQAIVARTLEALEAEREREAAADLPRIAEGRRQ